MKGHILLGSILIGSLFYPQSSYGQSVCTSSVEFIASFIEGLCGTDTDCRWIKSQEFMACKDAEAKAWRDEALRLEASLNETQTFLQSEQATILRLQNEIAAFAQKLGTCSAQNTKLSRKLKRLSKTR